MGFRACVVTFYYRSFRFRVSTLLSSPLLFSPVLFSPLLFSPLLFSPLLSRPLPPRLFALLLSVSPYLLPLALLLRLRVSLKCV